MTYGQHMGWCTTCGRDTFDYVRHVCPKPLRNVGTVIRLRAALRAIANNPGASDEIAKFAAEKAAE